MEGHGINFFKVKTNPDINHVIQNCLIELFFCTFNELF